MKTTPKWYEIKAAAEGAQAAGSKTAEIYIYGSIGDKWDENSVTAANLVRDLAELDANLIILRINSYGGSVPDGLAIYNALKRHPAVVDVQIDGVAISCAGYIAMAGDTITMAENAMMMIHAPWSIAIGNSADMREEADMLDKYAHAMATSYAAKSGNEFDACLALLTDGKDHWYTADEALDAGFADTVGQAIEVAASLARSFDLSRFTQSAAPAAATTMEAIMPAAVTPAATPATPFSRTKDMNAEVLAIFKPFLDKDGIKALQTEVLADPSLTVEQIQSRLLNEIGKTAEPANPAGAVAGVETLEDETDKRIKAVSAALMVRAGVERDRSVIATMGANPFRGAKLLDLARASLQRAGVKTDGMDQRAIVAAAFTTSTSDFPVLLENTMHKTLQAAYLRAAHTWRRFCAVGSVSDFRAHNRYQVGSFGNLDSKTELGEFKNKTIPDGEKQSVTAATKGNLINISREAVINDDLGAFIGLANMLGMAYDRTIEADVFALLAQNSGLGPTMSDTHPMFYARTASGTNIGTGAALSMAAIDADRVVMGSQKDISGNDYLGLVPSILLVPMSLGGSAKAINTATYDPDTANKLQKPNIVNGLFSDIVDTPRLTGTRRYLFADPMIAPVIEVAFLDGAEDPYLEMQNGWEVDGAQYKVRADYAVGGVGYQGAVTNAGA